MNANLPEVLNAKPGLRHVHPQIIRDALYCFSKFDTACVEFLRDNTHRLTRHTYMDEEGYGCIFGLLTEPLPEKERIRDRSALTTWFTGGCGYLFRERPEYQPARYLVRVWDGDRDPGTEERYECWRGHLTKQNIRDLAEVYLELKSRSNREEAVAVAVALTVAR